MYTGNHIHHRKPCDLDSARSTLYERQLKVLTEPDKQFITGINPNNPQNPRQGVGCRHRQSEKGKEESDNQAGQDRKEVGFHGQVKPPPRSIVIYPFLGRSGSGFHMTRCSDEPGTLHVKPSLPTRDFFTRLIEKLESTGTYICSGAETPIMVRPLFST